MRSKLWILAGIALAGALTLFAATQVWLTVAIADGAAAFGWIWITGQQVNQSLSPIAIASLAAALALTIAGRVFRVVLGVLVALLGLGITAIASIALRDPLTATLSRVSEATGLTGDSHTEIVTGIESSPLIVVTLIAGAILSVLGILVLVLGGRWKKAGRKYESDTARKASVNSEPDRISDWETMNAGEDPSDTEEDGDLDDPHDAQSN